MKLMRWLMLAMAVLASFPLPMAAAAGQSAAKTVILATTTSTQDSGLLDLLLPVFEKETGYRVKTIAVGSGQAMAMGKKGEADVLLVHSPEAEKTFMAEGAGVNRRLVMHNDYLLVGPATDPAGGKGAQAIVTALRRIAASGAPFISRGDNSGTHAKEKALWKAGGENPDGQKWYQQTGLGMGQTLNVAAEKRGYTLTDRATYLALKKNTGLVVISEGDNKLLNVYHVIEVNPVRWPKVNANGGRAFADFVVSKRAQQLIGRFGVDKYAAPLFVPDAGLNPASLGL